jgi:hypothetical protein
VIQKCAETKKRKAELSKRKTVLSKKKDTTQTFRKINQEIKWELRTKQYYIFLDKRQKYDRIEDTHGYSLNI